MLTLIVAEDFHIPKGKEKEKGGKIKERVVCSRLFFTSYVLFDCSFQCWIFGYIFLFTYFSIYYVGCHGL